MRLFLPLPLNIFHYLFLTFCFWFASDLVSFIFRNGGPPPVLSYIAFLAYSVGFFLIQLSQGRQVLTTLAWAQCRKVWLWLFLFLEWNLFSFLISSQSEVALQRLITSVEMILVFMAFLWFLLERKLHQPITLIMAVVAILGSIINIQDFFNPTYSSVPGRAAGLYENPNISGFILILSMSSAMAPLSIQLRRALIAIVSIAVFLTFSRASWFVLGVSCLWLARKGYLGGKATRVFVTMVVGISAAIFVFTMLSGVLANVIASLPIASYLDANTLARLGSSAFATDYSASERMAVAQFAITSFFNGENQIFGVGLGHTYEWGMNVSTHNMYLLFLVEGGLVGLILFLSLLAILWKSAFGVGRLVVFQVAVNSLFDHNLLDSPVRIIFLAMVAAGVLNSGNNTKRPQGERASFVDAAPPHNGPEYRGGRTFTS